MMIGLSRLIRAIADVPTGGMQTGNPKVVLKLADAQRIKAELECVIAERDALAKEVDAANDRNAELVEERDALAGRAEKAELELVKLSMDYNVARDRHDALAVMTEGLKLHISRFHEIDGAFSAAQWQNTANALVKLTLQQCLRNVQAEAIDNATTYLADSIPDKSYESVIFKDRYVYISTRYLREYAAKLRQGGAE